jgi:hypothetical protein
VARAKVERTRRKQRRDGTHQERQHRRQPFRHQDLPRRQTGQDQL